MQIVARDPAEFMANPGLLPQAGTATVVPGIGAFLDASVLQELVDAPDPAQRLKVLLEALERETELTASMAMFRKNITGVDNVVYISLKFPGHVPRLKVAIDPAARLDPFGDNASVAIADGKHLDGTKMPSWLRKQVEWFLDLNRSTLIDYWEGRLDTDELRTRLLANRDKVEAGRPR